MAPADLGSIPDRLQQPATQQAAAGRARTVVQSRQQCRRSIAPNGLDDLEIAPCHRIEHDTVVTMVDPQWLQMGRGMPLSACDIGQQCTGGSDCLGQVIRIAARQACNTELFGQLPPGALGIELPGRASADWQSGCGQLDRFECGITGSRCGHARAGR